MYLYTSKQPTSHSERVFVPGCAREKIPAGAKPLYISLHMGEVRIICERPSRSEYGSTDRVSVLVGRHRLGSFNIEWE